MDTLSQVMVAVVLSIAIAIPLGIWSARSDRFQRVLKPLLDAMQTMPAFVYLVPVIALFQLGRVPGVIAAVDLRAAAGDPAHGPRDPAGAEGDRSKRRWRTARRRGSCC